MKDHRLFSGLEALLEASLGLLGGGDFLVARLEGVDGCHVLEVHVEGVAVGMTWLQFTSLRKGFTSDFVAVFFDDSSGSPSSGIWRRQKPDSASRGGRAYLTKHPDDHRLSPAPEGRSPPGWTSKSSPFSSAGWNPR